MRTLKLVIAWIIVSFALQTGILVYANYIYFGEDFKDDIIGSITGGFSDKPEPAQFTIGENVTDIKISYDGRYAAYIQDADIVIADLKDKKELIHLGQKGMTPSFHHWLPDRNRIFSVYKDDQGKTADFKLCAYDVDNARENAVIDTIKGTSSDAEVEDVKFSTLTMQTYVKLRTSSKATTVYKINTSSNVNRIGTRVGNIVNMSVLNCKDVFLYEDTQNQKVYIQEGGASSFTVPVKKKIRLIGVDAGDMIYAAEMEKDKVIAIYKGSMSKDAKQWKRTALQTPVKFSELYMVPKGEIYVHTQDSNEIRRLSDGKTIQFEGKFIQILNDFVVTLNDKVLDVKVIG